MMCGAFVRCGDMIGTHILLSQHVGSELKEPIGKIRWPASAEQLFNYLLQQLYMGARVPAPIPFYMNALYCNILNRLRTLVRIYTAPALLIPISPSPVTETTVLGIFSNFDNLRRPPLGGKRLINSMRFI